MFSRATAFAAVRRFAHSNAPPVLVGAQRSVPNKTFVTSSLAAVPQVKRRCTMSTLGQSDVASAAWEKSCYMSIDFTIKDEATVYEAVQKFSAFNIGCLVTVNDAGSITGVVSERDYVNKIALLGRNSRETKVSEISTKAARLITTSPSENVHDCLQKMLSNDIRHLPMINDDGDVMGMLSVKDLVKAVVEEKEKALRTLSDFALGKGGHFGAE